MKEIVEDKKNKASDQVFFLGHKAAVSYEIKKNKRESDERKNDYYLQSLKYQRINESQKTRHQILFLGHKEY